MEGIHGPSGPVTHDSLLIPEDFQCDARTLGRAASQSNIMTPLIKHLNGCCLRNLAISGAGLQHQVMEPISYARHPRSRVHRARATESLTSAQAGRKIAV